MHKNSNILNIIPNCNRCGKRLRTLPTGGPEEALHVDITWGFFSKKDTERHRFVLCEDCYDELVASFQIPVEVSEINEVI